MQRNEVRRGLIEIFIVVVGILLAFGVEALWQDAQDRRLRAEVLSGIGASFGGSRAELEVQMGRRARKLDATRQLSIFVTARSAPSPDSVATLLQLLRTYQDFDSDDSRLRELLASGRMHLIRDADLRARLAGWERRFADLEDVEGVALDHSMRVVDAWLSQRVPVTGGPGRYDQVPPRSLTAADIQLLRSLEFGNLLRQQYFLDQLALEKGESMLAQIDEIIGLISSELGNEPTAS